MYVKVGELLRNHPISKSSFKKKELIIIELREKKV